MISFFQKKLFFFFFFVVQENKNKAHVTERCVREWERESSHLWYPYSLQGSAPESNFSASGISFPRISWPKARLPSPDSRKADGPGLQTYSTCGGPYWKKKNKKQKTNGLLCSSKADRCWAPSFVDGWTGVSNAQTAHGEECASVQQPTQAESCGSGSKGQERGGSIGACVGSCCFNPDENSASATCQRSR